MNSSLREDVYALHIPTLFFLLHPLMAGLSTVTSVHEVTAAACLPSRRPAAHSPPHISRRQVSRTCGGGGSPITTGVFSHSAHTRADRERQSTQFEQLSDHAGDLEELVLLSLLQSHQGPGRLLRVLGVGEDAPHSLFRLHVAGFLEESHQGVLIDILEDVGHGLLAVRRVKLVAVDRRADPAAFRGHVGRHLVSLFLRWMSSVSLLQVWPSNSVRMSC